MKKYYEKKMLKIRFKDKHRIHSEQFTAEQIARILNVSLQTAYKYMNDQHAICASKRELLEIKGLGKIPFPDWDGFYFDQQGRLIGRNGYSMNAEQISYFTITKQQLTQAELEIKRLRERITELEQEARGTAEIIPFKA